MQLIGLITFSLFISSFGILRGEKVYRLDSLFNSTDSLNFVYINRFIMEHAILFPNQINDLYPIIETKEKIDEIAIFHIKYKDDFIDSVLVNRFFQPFKNIKRIPNNEKMEQQYVFDQYKIVRVFFDRLDHATGMELLKVMEPNFIGFAIGDAFKSGTKYYVPVRIVGKHTFEDQYYINLRIYEFEICDSGIYFFKKYFGVNSFYSSSNSNDYYLEYVINYHSCE